MEKIERILSVHPFFEGIDPEYIAPFAKEARSSTFDPGEFLMRVGEPTQCFYLILHGKVAIETFASDRGPIIIQTFGEGEMVGYCWIIPPYQCRFDIRAVEFTRAICIEADKIRQICEENHEIGYELLKRVIQSMSGLLEATRLQLLDLYGGSS
jgi:CRP-like cAMP-binding protein